MYGDDTAAGNCRPGTQSEERKYKNTRRHLSSLRAKAREKGLAKKEGKAEEEAHKKKSV